MASLATLFQTCEPRPEVLSGDLPDAIFAADLWQVYEERAHPDYQDAQRFLTNTFPTESMRFLLREVTRTLSGRPGGTPVFRLETGFGGGKTHSLIAALHIAREGSRLEAALRRFEPSEEGWTLPSPGTVGLGVFVGEQSDPAQGLRLTIGGRTVRTFTPWGQLALQIGGPQGYEVVRASDEAGTAPSRKDLEDAFGQSGKRAALILVDELVHYVARAAGLPAGHPRRNVASQFPTFFHSLFSLASTPGSGVVVILTLPSEKDAHAAITATLRQQITESLTAVTDTEKTVDRFATTLTPTQAYERAAVLIRRLFKSVDLSPAKTVAAAFESYYREQAETQTPLDSRAFQSQYMEQIASTYPFHPEMIRLLSERLAEIPEFQATRGTLRLMARIIRSVWSKRDTDPPPIVFQPHHIDLANAEIQDEILTRLKRQDFRHALESDVAVRGGIPHARMVEEGWAYRYCSEAALVTFLHSLPEGSNGVNAGEVALALGRPEATPPYDLAYIPKALEELYGRGWHLTKDRDRYLFRKRAGINKRFLTRLAEVQREPGTIKDQLDSWIEDLFGTMERFQVVVFPEDYTAFPDTPDRLRLGVIHYDKECGRVNEGHRLNFTRELYDRAGHAGGGRKFKNTLVFLLAEAARVDGFKREVGELIGWERVKADLEREREAQAVAVGDKVQDLERRVRRGDYTGIPLEFAALTADMDQANLKIGEKELAVRTALLDAYRVLAFPIPGGEPGGLFGGEAAQLECLRVEFGAAPTPGARGRRPTADRPRDAVPETPLLEALRNAQKLIPEVSEATPVPLDPRIVWEQVRKPGERRVSTRAVWERLREDPTLPLLLEEVQLLPTLKAGVLTSSGDKHWVYFNESAKRSYTSETVADLDPAISDREFLYDPRAAHQDQIIPPAEITPAELWERLWPRDEAQRLPRFPTRLVLDAALASPHYPVTPAREVIWKSLREGARESRWILYLPASRTAIGAQELDEWPASPRFDDATEVWEFGAAQQAGIYPRQIGPPAEVTPRQIRDKCWPPEKQCIGTETLLRNVRAAWPSMDQPRLEGLLAAGFHDGVWYLAYDGTPEAFYASGDTLPQPPRVAPAWFLVVPESEAARKLEPWRPGLGPQPIEQAGTPREVMTRLWEGLGAHKGVSIAELSLTVDRKHAYDQTLCVAWPDRPRAAQVQVVVHAEGGWITEGRRENLAMDFSGGFDSLREVLAPVWGIEGRGGQVLLTLTVTLRFPVPVSLSDPELMRFRDAVREANQGELVGKVVPSRGAGVAVLRQQYE